MKTKKEIEQLATKNYRSNGSGGGQYTEGLHEGRIIGFIDGYAQCQKDMVKNSKEEFYKYGESLGIKINDLQRLRMLTCNEPSRNFYLRLKNFVSNVQVNDMMSEEEKEMIISVCDKQLNKQN